MRHLNGFLLQNGTEGRRRIWFKDLLSAQGVGDVTATELSERQGKIIAIIKSSPTITAKKMSESLSVSQRTIERDIAELKKKGILQRRGNDHDDLWIITV